MPPSEVKCRRPPRHRRQHAYLAPRFTTASTNTASTASTASTTRLRTGCWVPTTWRLPQPSVVRPSVRPLLAASFVLSSRRHFSGLDKRPPLSRRHSLIPPRPLAQTLVGREQASFRRAARAPLRRWELVGGAHTPCRPIHRGGVMLDVHRAATVAGTVPTRADTVERL